MEKQTLTPPGGFTFEAIRRNNLMYVDKTAYLSEMIENAGKKWFLARPEGFGGTLSISTLEAMFSGKKDLFKGLAADDKLDGESFSPRPIIRLNMKDLNVKNGVEALEKSLIQTIRLTAESMRIELPERFSPGDVFGSLLRECHLGRHRKAAVLIDGYDAPLVSFFSDREKLRRVRDMLESFYLRIHSGEEHISFAFFTGVTRDAYGGYIMDLINSFDVSRCEGLTAASGFTLEEIKKYFLNRLEEMAAFRKTDVETILEKLKRYSGIFLFDGVTPIYNSYSVLAFFNSKDGAIDGFEAIEGV
ncbi:MAG: AAA family ATPase [Deltaproteobacteria bacterium]|jgi:hypothetical protein|nr:AAA family ATPase [Deltaproteobacteria bacterium]